MRKETRKLVSILILGIVNFFISLSNLQSSSISEILRRVKSFKLPAVTYSFPGITYDDRQIASINEEYKRLYAQKKLGFKELPYQRPDSIMSIGSEKISLKELAEKAKERGIKTLLWLGIGGQGNGNKAVHYTLKGENMDVIVVDNLEGWLIHSVLDKLDPNTTMVAISSKSFTTDETMENAAIAIKWLIENLGKEKALERVIFNSDNVRGANKDGKDRVNEVAMKLFGKKAKYVFPISVIKDGEIYNVGGRWSVLNSGIISATLAGIDVEAMLKAAQVVEDEYGKAEMNDILRLALYNASAFEDGKDILVIVATSPRLRRVAEWLKQHTGETLGENGKGPHPYVIVAKSNDELQKLYNSHQDKVFLFLHDEEEGFEPEIPDGVSYIVYKFPKVDPANLGAYFQFFNEWALRFGLALEGVDPLDQPWVEKGKAGATTYEQWEKSPYADVTRNGISFDPEKTGIKQDELNDLDEKLQLAISNLKQLSVAKVISEYEEIKEELNEDYSRKIQDKNTFTKGLQDGYTSDEMKKLAAQMAGYAYLLKDKGYKVMYSVIYNIGLEAFGLWVEKIAMERLADKGVILTKAIGSLNQHDLLQLWGDGPAIGYLMGVVILDKDNPLPIEDNPFLKPEVVKALEGKDTGFIYDAMWEKITQALRDDALTYRDAERKERGRPTSTLFIPELNDYYFGQLFALYDMFTQIYANLLLSP